MPGSDRLDIRLLGPLEIVADGRPLVVDTRKALAIVALLAAERRSFAREELAALLWPDADDESARGALRRTLSSLRAALGGRWLRADRSTVGLDPDGVSVDLDRATAVAAGGSVGDLAAAADLHRGPFMAGFTLRDAPEFDDWQAARATAVAAQFAGLLDRLTSALHEAGDAAGAVAAARRRIDLDPLDEGGQRRLIELLAATGDRSGAIRQYRACVAVLEAELGVPPLAETTELYERVRDDRVSTSAAVAPLTSPPSPVAGAPRLPAADAPPFVGRAGELETLLAAHGAVDRDGALAIVEGEVGIGKTRLAEVFSDAVRRRGARVLGARCYPGEQSVAYGPIIALLRAGLALPGGADRLASLSEVARTALTSLDPAVSAGGGRRGRSLVPLDEGAARARLLDAIADGLTALTVGDAAGLVWLDDVNWADEATLETIAYLGRRLAGRSLLVLVTWRREDLDGIALQTVAGFERTARAHVRLRRLDRDAVASLIGALAPDESRQPGVIDALATRSEGVPLYIVEALAAPRPSAAPAIATATATAIPPGVRALVAERLASLDGAAGQLIAAAAVIGRSFDAGMLRHVSGRTEDEVIDGLDRLVRRGFVRETATATVREPAFDFVHGSVREVVLEGSSLTRKRLLHRRVAEAVAARPVASLGEPAVVDRLDGSVAASAAVHLRDAGHDREAALAFARAADHARSVHANAEAAELARSALALGHPDPARLHVVLGDIATLSGRYGEAIAEFEGAAAAASAASATSPASTLSAASADDEARDRLADLEHRLALVHQRRGDPDTADTHFVAALELTADRATRARILADRSLGAHLAGRGEQAAALAADALAASDESGDDLARARAANVAGVLATERGDPAAGRVLIERSLALAEARGEIPARIAALNNLARAVAATGDVDLAIEFTDLALGLCRSIGDRHREAALHNHRADLLREAGRRDAAIDELKQAVAIFADVGEPGELEPGKWRLATW
ncbi:MAG TPA: AAA family ATPase [Candidatus Limnocylindrales bacterium]|nr:AAA family ATPase [Candidatus Limnocylindrales bacterium]